MSISLEKKATPPTTVRHGVLGFACSLSMITYLDRVCVASAGPKIVDALHLPSIASLDLAFTAFAFAYAAFEVPSGWMGDVFGPRRTLIRIVLWWSVFTALTGLTGLVTAPGYLFLTGLGALVVIRFLFGMGEAGAYPNITRALHNWFPRAERGFSQGMVWMSGRLMGGLTPLLWMVLVEYCGVSWRAAFWAFGGMGIVWCVAFSRWFRNRPAEHPHVNDEELALIDTGREAEAALTRVPWRRFLTSGNLWALCLMYFCGSFGWYFNITYLPSFLEEQYGVAKTDVLGAIYKGGPLWMGAMTCLLGGWLSDRFIRRTGNRRWGRRLFGLVGHGLCGLCYAACLFTPSAFTFFLAISFAAFWNDLTMGSAWATCQDVGRRYAAIVAGCMNTVGNMGGAAAGKVTGYILQSYLGAYAVAHGPDLANLTPAEKAAASLPGYRVCFVLFAAVYFVGVLLWLRIDSTSPIVPDPGEAPRENALDSN
jgi:ACS family glucarate transporter-like MFS transporter